MDRLTAGIVLITMLHILLTQEVSTGRARMAAPEFAQVAVLWVTHTFQVAVAVQEIVIQAAAAVALQEPAD